MAISDGPSTKKRDQPLNHGKTNALGFVVGLQNQWYIHRKSRWAQLLVASEFKKGRLEKKKSTPLSWYDLHISPMQSFSCEKIPQDDGMELEKFSRMKPSFYGPRFRTRTHVHGFLSV